jgi:valyl-tRNA synthetase
VDPLDIIASHGADAMRFTLAMMTTSTQDVRMPVERDPATGRNTSPKFDVGRNFCNKLWNAARFVLGKIQGQRADALGLQPADRWILSRLARTVRGADQALRGYEFNEYVQTIYDFFWRDYCDWYLELVKPVLAAGGAGAEAGRAVLAACLDTVLRLLHPVAPFVTERLWQELNRVAESRRIAGATLPASPLCITAPWPSVDGALIDERAERQFEMVQQVTGAIRNMRSEHNVPPKQLVKTTIRCPEATAEVIEAARAFIGPLASVEITQVGPDARPGPDATVAVVGEIEMYLEGLVDRQAEKTRLGKRLDELTRSVTALRGRLDNPGYIAKAPPALVEESKAKLDESEREIATLEQKLKLL